MALFGMLNVRRHSPTVDVLLEKTCRAEVANKKSCSDRLNALESWSATEPVGPCRVAASHPASQPVTGSEGARAMGAN